jgi:hypothetical protein
MRPRLNLSVVGPGLGKICFRGSGHFEAVLWKSFIVLSKNPYVFRILYVILHLSNKFHQNCITGTGSTIEICMEERYGKTWFPSRGSGPLAIFCEESEYFFQKITMMNGKELKKYFRLQDCNKNWKFNFPLKNNFK